MLGIFSFQKKVQGCALFATVSATLADVVSDSIMALLLTNVRRGGGMADAEDLKSSGPKGRAGSSPALGIIH